MTLAMDAPTLPAIARRMGLTDRAVSRGVSMLEHQQRVDRRWAARLAKLSYVTVKT